MKTNVAQFSGFGVKYRTGGKTKIISPGKLREIRSKVRTHEGQLLTGRDGRRYMDKYSKKYLGKDLERSYTDQKIIGNVK